MILTLRTFNSLSSNWASIAYAAAPTFHEWPTNPGWWLQFWPNPEPIKESMYLDPPTVLDMKGEPTIVIDKLGGADTKRDRKRLMADLRKREYARKVAHYQSLRR